MKKAFSLSGIALMSVSIAVLGSIVPEVFFRLRPCMTATLFRRLLRTASLYRRYAVWSGSHWQLFREHIELTENRGLMPFTDWFSRFAGKRTTSEQPVSQVAIPTVKFDTSLVTDTVQEMVREEIAQLSEIHGEYRDDITTARNCLNIGGAGPCGFS